MANNGSRLTPHLLKEVHKSTDDDSLGKTIFTYKVKELNKVDTKEEYMARVHEGFHAVINSSVGYGRGYMDTAYDPSGKTGTSQSFIDTDNDGVIDKETITSTFVGYAPSNNPKMSIAVVSPNSSRSDTSNTYASMVTKRITKRATDAYFTLNP